MAGTRRPTMHRFGEMTTNEANREFGRLQQIHAWQVVGIRSEGSEEQKSFRRRISPPGLLVLWHYDHEGVPQPLAYEGYQADLRALGRELVHKLGSDRDRAWLETQR